MLAQSSGEVNRNRIFKLLDSLEPFSPVVHRLVSTLSADPDTISLSRVGDLIEKDTVLAGKLLFVANSAFFSRGIEVVSVHRAVSRLGINKVRNTVLALSLNRVWKDAKIPEYWSMLRFNLHSLATAIAADLLAVKVPTPFPEGAFISGLFHDVGRLAIGVMLQDRYEPLCQADALDASSLRESEVRLLGFDHCQVSAEIVAHWKLPSPVQRAVRYHEAPETDPTVVMSSQFPLSKVVHIADRYATSLGITICEAASSDRQDSPEQVADPLTTSLYTEFKPQFDMIRNLVN